MCLIFGYISPNNKFSIFLQLFLHIIVRLQPTKLVHVELCSRSCSPHMRIYMDGDYLVSGPDDLLNIRTHVKGGLLPYYVPLSLIYPCEEVTLQTERACQV